MYTIDIPPAYSHVSEILALDCGEKKKKEEERKLG